VNKNEISKSYSKALELHNKILVSAQLAQNSLWDMCAGLKEMRDGKLYKELGYQNFEDYCGTEFNMTAGNARRYISIIENIPEENRAPVHGFGMKKLYLLSTLSEAEQAEITAENDVENMTVKQLESEIKQLKEKNSELKLDLDELAEEHERTCEQATADSKTISGLRQNISALNQTIEELESRPIEVAVAEPSDEVRRLEDTIKNLQRVTDEQLDRVQEDHLAAERKLRQEHAAALEQQKKEFEEQLAAARNAEGDDKQVFKAYFAAAYDTFNRMLAFAKASPNKEFFREKINKLITTLETSTGTM
jgi:chromosome segregation ATPase